MAQLRACAEDVFHSTSFERSDLVLRLAREHWSSKKDDSAAHKTHQHDGYEGLIASVEGFLESVDGNSYRQNVTQESFMGTRLSVPATKSTSSVLVEITIPQLRYILLGSKILSYTLRI